MAGREFKELAASIKADVLQALKSRGRKMIDRANLADNGETLSAFLDYYLIKPLFNLRDETPTTTDVNTLVDQLITKHFAADSKCRSDFRVLKLNNDDIDNIIKPRFARFKEDYQNTIAPAKWQPAVNTEHSPAERKQNIVLGKRENISAKQTVTRRPAPKRGTAVTPAQSAIRSGRPLPAIPSPVKDNQTPPDKPLPPDPPRRK